MIYNPFGRVVLFLVIILCIIFLRSPWKSFFVYPTRFWQGKLFRLKSIVRVWAVVLSMLWAFNIKRIDWSSLVQTPQQSVMFLLDGSLSMSANDTLPNRFSHATSLISSLVEWVSWSDSSLIVFSWLPVIRVPWTHDASWFVQVLSGLRLGEFPATEWFLWTALGDALLLSLQQFQTIPADSSRAIVIISDGDSNKWYDPEKVLWLLQQRHIPIYFVAIGTEGYRVGTDRTGLPVVTSFDTELMQHFTEQTDGKLYMNPDETQLNELIQTLNNTSNTKEQTIYIPRYVELNAYIAPWLLFFFLVIIGCGLINILSFVRKN